MQQKEWSAQKGDDFDAYQRRTLDLIDSQQAPKTACPFAADVIARMLRRRSRAREKSDSQSRSSTAQLNSHAATDHAEPTSGHQPPADAEATELNEQLASDTNVPRGEPRLAPHMAKRGAERSKISALAPS